MLDACMQEDEDDEEEGDDVAADAYSALVSAGVHQQIAVAASDAGEVHMFILAWALLLAALLGAEPGVRLRLSQALGDADQ